MDAGAPSDVILRRLTPTPSPLVVILHGSGEIGTDNERQLTRLALAWARDETRRAFPAFVLAPQMPARSAIYAGEPGDDRRTSAPGPPLEATLGLIDRLVETKAIDRDPARSGGRPVGYECEDWTPIASKPNVVNPPSTAMVWPVT